MIVAVQAARRLLLTAPILSVPGFVGKYYFNFTPLFPGCLVLKKSAPPLNKAGYAGKIIRTRLRAPPPQFCSKMINRLEKQLVKGAIRCCLTAGTAVAFQKTGSWEEG